MNCIRKVNQKSKKHEEKMSHIKELCEYYKISEEEVLQMIKYLAKSTALSLLDADYVVGNKIQDGSYKEWRDTIMREEQLCNI